MHEIRCPHIEHWTPNLELSHAPKALPQTESGVPRERKTLPWTDVVRRKVGRGQPAAGTKAGLRAQTVALPHEPAERSERCDQWHDHYGPRSPASIHMTNQCARMTILSDQGR